MRKYLYLFVSLVAISCATDDNLFEYQHSEVVVQKSTNDVDRVHLIKALTSYSFYRGYGTYHRRFVVSVINQAFESEVYVYHQKLDGDWIEIPMHYIRTVGGDRELWELDNTEFETQTLGDQFVIKFKVNDQVYWDNNNGNNYQMSRHEGFFFAQPDLNVSVDEKLTSIFYSSYENKNIFSVLVDVKNIAPVKEVQIVYTTNGWKTTSYAALTYVKYWYNGYNKVIESPNDFGIERWSGSVQLDLSIQDIEYAIVYKVNDQEYWDNNYGKNYTLSASN